MRHYKEPHNDYQLIRDNIKVAFKKLRKQGYFCRSNFWCCQSCGWSAVPENKSSKVVFYHKQDTDSLKERGSLFLAWEGRGSEIVNALNDSGLKAKWDGKEDTRIEVSA
jgi:hypothetical protein